MLACAGGLSACGRRATQADCDHILDRMVELQLKDMQKDDPAELAELSKHTRSEMSDKLKECVGRRVTDSMMACVDKATTPKEAMQCAP